MDPFDSGAGDRPVVLAAVAGAHGVGGAVRLKLFSAFASVKAHRVLHAGPRALSLRELRETPAGAIARFTEVADRDAAEALRGQTLSVPRAALPPPAEGEYYWHDLVGLPVETTDGAPVGVVVAVDNYGASDVIEVERADGARVLVPLTPDAVPEVGARVRIDPVWAEA